MRLAAGRLLAQTVSPTDSLYQDFAAGRGFLLPMDSLVHKLHATLGAQGCAVCRLRRQVEEGYLEGFLYESVNDRTLRDQLAQSLGFCRAHAWQLQQVEMHLWGGGLGVGIVY